MSAATEIRFGPLPRRTVLAGLTGAQLGFTAAAVVIVILAEYTGGLAAVAITSPAWVLLAGLGTVSVSGRTALGWLPLLGSWVARRATGRTTALTRPQPPAPDMVGALPGVAGHLRLVRSATTSGGYWWDRRTRTLTAVLPVTGSGFLLAASDGQDVRVFGWARVLDGLCRQPGVARVQLLHRTVPASSGALRAWWGRQLTAGTWPDTVVADLLADSDQQGSRTECLLAVALHTTGSGRRRGDPSADAVAVADRQVTALIEALRAADLHAEPALTPAGLRRAAWSGFDPFAAAAAPVTSDTDGALGPLGVRELWDHVVTDTAHHGVYWVSDWPRTATSAGFLQPLLLAPGQTRTVTVIAEPLTTSRALREIRRAQVEHAADAGQRTRIGQLEDEATRAQARELDRREADLVAGHGELAFTALVTVTARTPEELAAGCAATEAAAAQAMCELRRLVGQQAAAHTAACVPIARSLS